MQKYYSNGKLLLTGEYVVLDGALSLAMPTKYGQSLKVEPIEEPKIIWTSLDEEKNVWFENEFLIEEITSPHTSRNDDISNRLTQILNEAKKLNPSFLASNKGFKITTELDFSKNWGLGTSSTLINNIAQWAEVDAYSLLRNTFDGSGYDIACTQHNSPITYQLFNNLDEISHDTRNDKKRNIQEIEFNPSFTEHLYFVFLNKKQNSRKGIKHYNANKEASSSAISEISDITSKIITCNSLETFEKLITTHEQIISKIIKQKLVKDLFFNDFKGNIKSLGAWGGDFVLATSKENPTAYFKTKGFNTVIPYKDMVL